MVFAIDETPSKVIMQRMNLLLNYRVQITPPQQKQITDRKLIPISVTPRLGFWSIFDIFTI